MTADIFIFLFWHPFVKWISSYSPHWAGSPCSARPDFKSCVEFHLPPPRRLTPMSQISGQRVNGSWWLMSLGISVSMRGSVGSSCWNEAGEEKNRCTFAQRGVRIEESAFLESNRLSWTLLISSMPSIHRQWADLGAHHNFLWNLGEIPKEAAIKRGVPASGVGGGGESKTHCP